MKVSKIGEFTNGIKSGDNCENCDTEIKPIYHLEDDWFGVDIILCPTCIEKMKEKINAINLA